MSVETERRPKASHPYRDKIMSFGRQSALRTSIQLWGHVK